MSAAVPVRPLALRFPLHGSRLIEASAGTGKTWTLSALYVRLVLGHGAENGFARPLLPPEILVVTFTRDASGELRDRIRARLVDAANAFREQCEPDDFLRQLRAAYPPEQWPQCAWHLDLAAQWMDEAAISTIHGWCQRMLREHAFASGSLFNETVESAQDRLRREAVHDYWREHCYPLTGDGIDWVVQHWETPKCLQEKIKGLLDEIDADMRLPSHSLAGLITAHQEELAALKQPWPAWCDELEALFDDGYARDLFHKGKLRADSRRKLFADLRAWACGNESLKLGEVAARLTPAGIADIWKSTPVPDHPALHALVDLQERVADLSAREQESTLRHAAAWVNHRFDREKRRQGEMDYNDMVSRLDSALGGDRGVQLAGIIRNRFPVALIDEFQDTDPLQYRIFDRLYGMQDNTRELGLFLIGDPKQAIYSFRGADIHTYLQARRATQGRHYHLDTNYRSSAAMVAATNRVFEHAEQRGLGHGAFAFRKDGCNPLPFTPVDAAGLDAQWQVDDKPAAALTWWHLAVDQPLSRGAYNEEMAARTASEIVRLLQLGRQQRAGFRNGDVLQAVQASDIAILVRDGLEARHMRRALDARGVRSVFLSGKESVYRSPEAADMLLWLRACAQPDDVRLLRSALATASIDMDLAQLERLGGDEREMESRVMQFRGYHERWQRHGVLPMLRKLMHDLAVPQRIQARADGERALTNLLHLAELLQQAAAQLDGEQALIRHLEQLCGQQDEEDEQVLRLESDDALVRVVTIHGSKGLEYPLVFLPFASTHRESKASLPLRIHDGTQHRVVFGLTPGQLSQAASDRMAEDLRLLYVALTRARHACWVGVANRGTARTSVLHESALGYLLGGGQQATSPADIAQWLDNVTLAGQSVVAAAPAADPVHLPVQDGALPDPQVRHPLRSAREHWWIASYSALRVGDGTGAVPLRYDDAAPDSATAQVLGEDDPAAMDEPVPQGFRSGLQHGIHAFPRGPAAGTFLHGLLEHVGDEGFARSAANAGAVRDQVARRCKLRGWTEWIDVLSDWLLALLHCPLPLGDGRQATLAGLRDYQPELEFWLAAEQVDVQQVDALVQQYVLPGVPRRGLLPDVLNGMFKGFIDLVFEHEGRYWVVDYKSNWLGAGDADYSQAAMVAAVVHWRYDLQYVSYLLALHRQLRARLPDYDYDRHIGGALYLFVRGQGTGGAGVFRARPPRELIEKLDALFRTTGVDA